MRLVVPMRILALIFSAIGVYELLQLVNIEVIQFMPTHATGPEGGLIVAGMALMFGSAASAIALALAFKLFQRDKTNRGSRLLLGWCSLVPLGFVAVFIYTYIHRT